MGKFKIIYDQKNCIGAGECEVLSKAFWKINNSNKADLLGSRLNLQIGKYELELDDALFKEQENVCKSCPAGCIKIIRG